MSLIDEYRQYRQDSLSFKSKLASYLDVVRVVNCRRCGNLNRPAEPWPKNLSGRPEIIYLCDPCAQKCFGEAEKAGKSLRWALEKFPWHR